MATLSNGTAPLGAAFVPQIVAWKEVILWGRPTISVSGLA